MHSYRNEMEGKADLVGIENIFVFLIVWIVQQDAPPPDGPRRLLFFLSGLRIFCGICSCPIILNNLLRKYESSAHLLEVFNTFDTETFSLCEAVSVEAGAKESMRRMQQSVWKFVQIIQVEDAINISIGPAMIASSLYQV